MAAGALPREPRRPAPVFQKRRRRSGAASDEQVRLEMLYRKHVEFASGHGVAVDADVAPGDPQKAVRLRTRVTPTYEVPMTTPPTADDNPALAGVVLDMRLLAEMDDAALFASLRQLTMAYTEWIATNRARIDAKADGLDEFDAIARQALDDCAEAQQRIDAGTSQNVMG